MRLNSKRKNVCLFIIVLLFVACGRNDVRPDVGVGEPMAQAEPILMPITTPEPIELGEALDEEELGELDEIDKKIEQMTIYEKIGQLFIVRMPDHDRARRLVTDYHIGGFVLFGSDVHSTGQVRQLISDLQEISKIPLFIAVDEEGGRVSRVGRLFPDRPGTAFSIGQSGDAQNAYYAYYTIGRQLSYLGINMNFAPVADIWTNPANTVIGDRAFGADPLLVSEMVEQGVRGLHSAGILSVIKHFPGHGDTVEDSHYNMAFFHHDRDRFDQKEALPFLSGIEAKADGIMIGHIATPVITPEYPNLPATFSNYLLCTIIREEWGFEGLIVTDALDMNGLTNYFSEEDITLKAFLAGSDILLMPSNPEQAVKTLVNAYLEGAIETNSLNESIRRILKSKNLGGG